jgi:hypothetical protein
MDVDVDVDVDGGVGVDVDEGEGVEHCCPIFHCPPPAVKMLMPMRREMRGQIRSCPGACRTSELRWKRRRWIAGVGRLVQSGPAGNGGGRATEMRKATSGVKRESGS